MVELVNVTLIIPTYKRTKVLARTVESISKQDCQPDEIIIIDATEPFVSKTEEWKTNFTNLKSKVVYVPAIIKGAAAQRNTGMELATNDVLGFCDDDILLEEGCLRNLWKGLMDHPECGGINAIMTNQSYHELGKISRIFYNFLNPEKFNSYAGRCFGPAIAFYPQLQDAPPDYVEVDWLNLGLTLYRKEVLPNPVFDEHFKGYSLMEDLALSLKVAKKSKLLTAQTAKIFHDSQPGDDKNNLVNFSEMDLVNRFFIMKNILNKTSFKDKWQLFLQQMFGAVSSRSLLKSYFWIGKIRGIKKIRSI